jgi:hypothetical protein
MTKLNTAFAFALSGLLAACGAAQETKKAAAEKITFTFEDAAVGAAPKGWTVAETKGDGTPAAWKVEAAKDEPARKQVLKVESKNKEAVFNLLLSGTSYAANLVLSVKVKADTGEDDRGGGVVWRAKDADNYYVTRWNPLEKNIRLYKVEAGKRTMLKSADVDADPKTWQEIKVHHAGEKIRVELGGKEVLAAEDATFKEGGKVGFWTKADASTFFDDLEISWTK